MKREEIRMDCQPGFPYVFHDFSGENGVVVLSQCLGILKKRHVLLNTKSKTHVLNRVISSQPLRVQLVIYLIGVPS
jgi:hypothetical protein